MDIQAIEYLEEWATGRYPKKENGHFAGDLLDHFPPASTKAKK